MKHPVCFILCALLAVLTSCDNDSMAIFKSSAPSVDQRMLSSMLYYNNELNCSYPEIVVNSDEYRVFVFSDPHVAYYNNVLTAMVDTFRHDKQAPVAICLGDLVEANQSYLWFQNPFEYLYSQKTDDTLFVALGNHDIFYDQYWEYISRWKTTTYCFTIHCRKKNVRDLYICLDIAEGTLGAKQMKWLKNMLQVSEAQDYRYIFVYTHVNIFRTDNTNADISTVAIEEAYELMYLFSKYHVRQFWAGHDHARDAFYQGGVQYIMLDSMEEEADQPAYMILHVSPSGLNNTFHTVKLNT